MELFENLSIYHSKLYNNKNPLNFRVVEQPYYFMKLCFFLLLRYFLKI